MQSIRENLEFTLNFKANFDSCGLGFVYRRIGEKLGNGRVNRMRSLKEFLADHTGAVTIEFTTLVPAFILILVFFIDSSMVYLTRSEMFNVARDAARRMSTDELASAEAVRAYVEQHLHLGDRVYVIDPEFDTEMTVTIGIRIGDAAIFGVWFDSFMNSDSFVENVIWARSTVRREPLF